MFESSITSNGQTTFPTKSRQGRTGSEGRG